jgi:AcrR family transcriptional regulator
MKTKTEARREAILAAAKAVFEEVGFEQATMSEITARVGGSKATLYRYFDSKEALFLELVRRTAVEHGGELMALLEPVGSCAHHDGLPPEAADLLALLDPNDDADVATSLKHFGARVLTVFQSKSKLATWRMILAATAQNAELGRLFYEQGPARGMKKMEGYFEGVMKAGKLRRADARVMTAHFRGLLEAETDEPSLFNARPEVTEEEAIEVANRAVDVFMRAYGPEA